MPTIIRGKSDSEIFTATPSFACPECLTVFFGTLPAGFTALGMCETCRSKLPECGRCGERALSVTPVDFGICSETGYHDCGDLCERCVEATCAGG